MRSKVFFSFLIPLLISVTSLAEVKYLRLGRGHVMAYEYFPAQHSLPTVVLLPGVNRALSAKEESVQALAQQGWGVILPSLSTQPLSIQGLNPDERPYFMDQTSLTVADFAKDIDQLVRYLQVRQAIAVTLSYTSSVAAYLDPSIFPNVIQTVPMIEPSESNPAAASQAILWESWFRLNPVMAPFWIRNFRDQSYITYWSQIVEMNLQSNPQYYGPSPRVSEIKKGYVSMARAAEDFDLREWSFHDDSRHYDFVLAGDENTHRLQNQIAVIKNYLKAGKNLRLIVVENSGHVLPSEQPLLYAEAISLLAGVSSESSSVVFMKVKSTEQLRHPTWLGREALEEWMQSQ